MLCKEAQILINERDLEQGKREELEEHLKTCSRCRKEEERLIALIGLLRGLQTPAVPQDLFHGVESKLTGTKSISLRHGSGQATKGTGLSTIGKIGIVGLLGAVITGGVLFWNSLQVKPFKSPRTTLNYTSSELPFVEKLKEVREKVKRVPRVSVPRISTLEFSGIMEKSQKRDWEKPGDFGYSGDIKKYLPIDHAAHEKAVKMLRRADRAYKSGASDGLEKGVKWLEKASISSHEVEPVIMKEEQEER